MSQPTFQRDFILKLYVRNKNAFQDIISIFSKWVQEANIIMCWESVTKISPDKILKLLFSNVF